MDFKEIDRHLAEETEAGKSAYLKGKSKYENPHEPGSLSFDFWTAGWHAENDNHPNTHN